VLKQLGDRDGALEEFRKTIALHPESAEAHLSVGQLLQQRGEAEAARTALEEAKRLRQRKADAQASVFAVSLGLRRAGEGDLAGAVESFREAVRLAPDSADAHYQLALALRRRGAAEEADVHFREARRLAPYLHPPPEG
jgi:Flp pilus assembly protein TadD